MIKLRNLLNEERGDIVRIQIGGPKGYYNWFIKKIDSTHFYMSNDKKSLNNGSAMAHHIGQHRGEEYYSDLYGWLKGRIPTPKLNGNKYKGGG